MKIEKIDPEENRIDDSISEPIPATAEKVNELIDAVNEMSEGCERYRCPNCGKGTFEGDRNHSRWWDSNGGHCTQEDKQEDEEEDIVKEKRAGAQEEWEREHQIITDARRLGLID